MIAYNKNDDVIRFKKQNHPSDKIKFKPIARALITDGEKELVRLFKKLADGHQRCLFHMTHELTPLLRYKDIISKEEALEACIKELHALGYRKAKVLVENAKNQLFTYIENWIKTGISDPKVTSLVERMMREIKRRIKRIGYRWSEKGAERMTRLILLQLSSTKQYWGTHWQEKKVSMPILN